MTIEQLLGQLEKRNRHPCLFLSILGISGSGDTCFHIASTTLHNPKESLPILAKSGNV